MKTLTIDKIFDNIKNEGQKSKETVEIANNISRIINNIVQTRIEMGITQQELADRCGLKQSAIARIEKLQVMPRLDTVIRIAKNLNLSIYTAKETENVFKINAYIPTTNISSSDFSYKYHTVHILQPINL